MIEFIRLNFEEVEQSPQRTRSRAQWKGIRREQNQEHMIMADMRGAVTLDGRSMELSFA